MNCDSAQICSDGSTAEILCHATGLLFRDKVDRVWSISRTRLTVAMVLVIGYVSWIFLFVQYVSFCVVSDASASDRAGFCFQLRSHFCSRWCSCVRVRCPKWHSKHGNRRSPNRTAMYRNIVHPNSNRCLVYA